jgi:hypothetical protein
MVLEQLDSHMQIRNVGFFLHQTQKPEMEEPKLIGFFCFFGFFFFSAGVWTQVFVLARQVLYCLSPTPNPQTKILCVLGLDNTLLNTTS